VFDAILKSLITANATKALTWVCLHLWGTDKGGKILAALTDAGTIDQIAALGASVLAKAK
jgi:hypothetical protein